MSASTVSYQVIDVFTSKAYNGNPLAVVDNTTDTLSTTHMKLMARLFNLSETTFICPPAVDSGSESKATWRLRSFLPNGIEVFGAGHNSLGAWWWIVYSGIVLVPSPTESESVYQQLGEDILPIHLSRSSDGVVTISMRQGKPVFLDPHPDKSSLAIALGITDVQGIGLEYKGIELGEPRVVTTSPARHLLVPVRNRDILKGISFADKERLSRELARANSYNSGVYVFTSIDEGYTHPRFEARFFSPGMGMEDPATGSAAGPLAAYLWDRGVLGWKGAQGESVDVEIVQGLRTGRECLMHVSVKPDTEGNSAAISISGTGVWVAGGEIVVPTSAESM
jgi:PhzF family phenazine biosynthesis protein